MNAQQIELLLDNLYVPKKKATITRFQLFILEVINLKSELSESRSNLNIRFPVISKCIEAVNDERVLDYELYCDRFFARKSTLLLAHQREMRVSTAAKFIRREINRIISFHDVKFINNGERGKQKKV